MDPVWHWDIRIKQYLESEWSSRPSPFALEVATHLKVPAKILELGAGAGQDSVYFAQSGHDVTATDLIEVGFAEIERRATESKLELKQVDVSGPLPFAESSFDCVYSQLSLHYFSDAKTTEIIKEIQRVLKTGGIFAVMVNSTKDPEYDAEKLDSDGLFHYKGLTKRYFSKETFAPFVEGFKEVLFDEDGRTPKDDEKDTVGMVRFIGVKR